MAENSLTNFANVLYSEAKKQREDVEKQLEKERAEVLSKKRDELKTKLARETKNMNLAFKHEMKLAISGRESELAKMLRHNRCEAAQSIFKEAAQKLDEFTKTPKYEEYLKSELAGVEAVFTDGFAECTLRKCDTELFKKLCPLSDVVITEAPDSIIGGFTLRNRNLGVFTDCTLKTKLDEQKENFCGLSELVID